MPSQGLPERSLKTGMHVDAPDFTHGLYKTRAPKDVVEIPMPNINPTDIHMGK